jgi:hypothetical protein
MNFNISGYYVTFTRIATFFASASLANAFSGLLAAAIDQLDRMGGKPGWAWIFILVLYIECFWNDAHPSWQEGIFTSVFGVMSFFLLPCSPETAHFLTEKERAYVVSALKDAGSISENDDRDSFSWTEVVRAAKSLHVWLLVVVSFFSGNICTLSTSPWLTMAPSGSIVLGFA